MVRKPIHPSTAFFSFKREALNLNYSVKAIEKLKATVAEINPVTPMLAMARQGFLGDVT
ncbi:MAG: hypothetical protein F6K24_42130, partial [Okeania sp. SIO2D1]|nr:hypothetical protein [Okeania sp. SIO2D1]